MVFIDSIQSHYSPIIHLCRFFTVFIWIFRAPDGRTLVVTSTDGYLSAITFDEKELGELHETQVVSIEKQV